MGHPEEVAKELKLIRSELDMHAEFIRVHEARWENFQKVLVDIKVSFKALAKKEAFNSASEKKINRVLNKIGSHDFSIKHYDKVITDIKKYNRKLSKRVLSLEEKKPNKE